MLSPCQRQNTSTRAHAVSAVLSATYMHATDYNILTNAPKSQLLSSEADKTINPLQAICADILGALQEGME